MWATRLAGLRLGLVRDHCTDRYLLRAGTCTGRLPVGDSGFLRNTKKNLVSVNIHQVREQYSLPVSWHQGARGHRVGGRSSRWSKVWKPSAGDTWLPPCRIPGLEQTWAREVFVVFFTATWIFYLLERTLNTFSDPIGRDFIWHLTTNDIYSCLWYLVLPLGTPKTPWGWEAAGIRCRQLSQNVNKDYIPKLRNQLFDCLYLSANDNSHNDSHTCCCFST